MKLLLQEPLDLYPQSLYLYHSVLATNSLRLHPGPQTRSEWHWFKQSPKVCLDPSGSILTPLSPPKWYLGK